MAKKKYRSSARKKRKAMLLRRAVLFIIAVLLMLLFLSWYLLEYLPGRNSGGADSSISQDYSLEESYDEGESSIEDSYAQEDSSYDESSEDESSYEESSEEEISYEESSEEESPQEETSDAENVNSEGFVYIDPNEDDWRLILVNKKYRLAENMEIETRTIQGEEVDVRIYDSLFRMLEDGERDSDREFLICSGYRSVDLQQELFENKIQRVMAADPGLSYEEAYEIASTEVAIPGASEHNTGLTVDICAVDFQMLIEEYEETSEAQWLKENCYKYGFILRYPKGKEDITQIIYEPWHFRYVGVEAATEIMTQGITLEEYLGKVDVDE